MDMDVDTVMIDMNIDIELNTDTEIDIDIIQYNVGLCPLQIGTGGSDNRLSSILFVIDIELSACPLMTTMLDASWRVKLPQVEQL